MELNQTIQRAGDLTQRLHEALEAQDHRLCDDLLKKREHALADFTEAHRDASRPERERYQDEVRALAEADRRLQGLSRQLLALVTGEFSGQLGQSAQGKYSRGGETTQACLDRKV